MELFLSILGVYTIFVLASFAICLLTKVVTFEYSGTVNLESLLAGIPLFFTTLAMWFVISPMVVYRIVVDFISKKLHK